MEKLIEFVFPALDDNMADPDYITSRVILSTKNDNVDKINIIMIERFHDTEMIYHSFDRAEDDLHGYYPRVPQLADAERAPSSRPEVEDQLSCHTAKEYRPS